MMLHEFTTEFISQTVFVLWLIYICFNTGKFCTMGKMGYFIMFAMCTFCVAVKVSRSGVERRHSV